MRVQDCGKSGFSIKIFVIAGKGLQGILETGKHQRVDLPLVPPGKITQLPGQGEGDQEISGRNKFGKLVIYPLMAFVVLAVGATPVAA